MTGDFIEGEHFRMRDRLLTAPPWTQALIFGPVSGLLLAGLLRWQGQKLTVAVIAGVGAAVVLTIMLARTAAVEREALQELSPDDWRRARRATWRGPLPDDPKVVLAAADLVARLRTGRRRWPFRLLMAFLVLVVIAQVVLLVAGQVVDLLPDPSLRDVADLAFVIGVTIALRQWDRHQRRHLAHLTHRAELLTSRTGD